MFAYLFFTDKIIILIFQQRWGTTSEMSLCNLLCLLWPIAYCSGCFSVSVNNQRWMCCF